MVYSTETRIQIVLLMAKLESPTRVIREMQRQGDKNVPERHAITSIYEKFLETGSVEDRSRSGRPSTITDEIVDEVEQILDEEPLNSVRNVARAASLSKYQAHRIMRDILGFKPYMMRSTQLLYDEDKDLRVEMAEKLIPILRDPSNEGFIFFSDESTFYLSGLVNKHNCRFWSSSNQFVTVEEAMNSAKVNVWCAMSSKQIIGPFFFDHDTVNKDDYLNMLKSFFHPIIRRQKLDKKIYFQQDGAPIHFSKEVRAWLDEQFCERWVGRGGSISWAPRSPDLTPLDFYLWGYIKTSIYTTPVNDIDDLKERITDEIKNIKQETLNKVFGTIVKRMELCIDVAGDSFEKYL
jgi:hypothetical protein